MAQKEFQVKYGFEKPYDSKDRDKIIISNLSDIQTMIYSNADPIEISDRINDLKHFMWDTEDIRDGQLSSSESDANPYSNIDF